MITSSDLGRYIDGIVEPVAITEVTGLRQPTAVGRHRNRRIALVVGAAVVLACVIATLVLVIRSSREQPLPKAATAPRTLTVIGSADCSALQGPNVRILLPVTLSNGHEVCVTDDDTTTTVYLDGNRGLTFTGGSLNVRAFGVIGRAGQGYVIGGDIGLNADGLRITFCNGKTVDLPNVNPGDPAFVFAYVPATRTGAAENWKYSQPLDAQGKPLEPRGGGPGRVACRS